MVFVQLFSFIGMVFALVLLVVVHRAIQTVSRATAGFYDWLVKGLIVFVLLYFMLLATVLFPKLVWWLTNGSEPRKSEKSWKTDDSLIVGTWNWAPDDQVVTIYPDHTVASNYNVTPTWKQVDANMF